uniref:Uncharacterized protein n=1 Tax=Amphimedon queenslandica TaxID=400682 RepID=A0A1X7VJ57_AMPQE
MVDLCQWRAAIGLWNCSRVSFRGVPQHLFRTRDYCCEVVPQKHNCTDTDHDTMTRSSSAAAQDNILHHKVSATGEVATIISWAWSLFSTPETVCFLFYLFLHILLLLSGDVELNPGPTSETKEVIRKKIEASLRSKYADLELATRGCIGEIRSQLYAKELIADALRDSGTYAQISDDIKAGMGVDERGPCKVAADQLNEELEEILKLEESQIKHSVSLEEEEQVIPKVPEPHQEFKLDPEAEKTILKSIQELSSSFTALLRNLKNDLEKVGVADVVEYLEENGLDYLPLEDLKTANNFKDLIRKVNTHYDFLDCSLLRLIAKEFATKALFEKFEEHSKNAAKFRESHTVDDLKDNLTEIFNPYLDDFEKGPIAYINLNKAWDSVPLSRLPTLIGCFFPDISTKSLTKHIRIKCRSVHITYYMTESLDQIQQIIACARERVDFMKHIGLYHLAINGEVILDEAKKNDFKFESALQEAAKVGDSEAVEVLLQIGGGTDVLGDISKALFHTSSNNHYRVVKLFLNEGANPNVRDTDGEPAIHAASRKGHHKIVELLLKENADPDAQYQINEESIGTSPLATLFIELFSMIIGKTALMAASTDNHYQVVELLLKANADPNIQKKDGQTALMLASQSGHTESIELLLKAGADPDIKEEDGWTALMTACQGGHTKVVELLLNANANLNMTQGDGATALMIASQNGFLELVKLLLTKDVDPNIQANNGTTALMQASYHGHHSIVELLLDKEANPNIQQLGNGRNALMLASQRGHYHVVELLLQQNSTNPNIQKNDAWTALMLACQGSHYQVVELLLKAGADPNIKEEDGWTALMIASQGGYYQAVQLLLNANADPNIVSDNGCTAIVIASQNGHLQVVKLLFTNNADPTIQKGGRTALVMASLNDRKDIIEFLIKEQEDHGFTTLMTAIHSEIIELVLSLLSAGIMTYIDEDHIQAAIHFSKTESEVDNQITELLHYYAEYVHGMKLSESQFKVIISNEMKQKVNQSSYHLDSNIRMASHLAQDPDEHPLLRYAAPLDKHSSDPHAVEEQDATEKFKAAAQRKLGQ